MIRRLLLGLVCRWRGHREKRVPPEWQPLDEELRYNRRCTRCGATRLARPRKSKGTT